MEDIRGGTKMNWKEKSKYYMTWSEYIALHPEIDETNQAAMRNRFEVYQDKMFNIVMTYLF